jgi:hypothetical protein
MPEPCPASLAATRNFTNAFRSPQSTRVTDDLAEPRRCARVWKTNSAEVSTREKKKTPENSRFPGFQSFDMESSKLEAPGIEPGSRGPQLFTAQAVATSIENPLAHALARESQNDPDLARLVDAWPTLSSTVKRMILAAFEASSPE